MHVDYRRVSDNKEATRRAKLVGKKHVLLDQEEEYYTFLEQTRLTLETRSPIY